MYKRLGLVDLISAIQLKVEDKTGLKCCDAVPSNAPSPFYFAEVVQKKADNTKTMLRDVFTVFIHAVAEPTGSSEQIYDLIQKLEEALSEEIELSEEYELILQTENGLQALKTDETDEKHAVISYDFTVCYGYKFK